MRGGLIFIYSLIPVGFWITTFLLLVITGVFGEYLMFATRGDGSLFEGIFINLGYFLLWFLDGVSLTISPMMAFFVCRHRQKRTSEKIHKIILHNLYKIGTKIFPSVFLIS